MGKFLTMALFLAVFAAPRLQPSNHASIASMSTTATMPRNVQSASLTPTTKSLIRHHAG